MLITGSKVPHFVVKAIEQQKLITISDDDLLGSYTLLFFYALDFSYLCPGELHSLQDNLKEFEKLNTRVIAISVDSIYTHARFIATARNKLGVEGTQFALVSDMSHQLSRAFNVLEEDTGHALRASFVLDDKNIVQYGSANSFAFGRSIKELLRIIEAIQSINNGDVDFCPVNWRKGLSLE